MSKESTNWFRDYLIVPILVGIIVMISQFALEWLLKSDKIVSLKADGPFALFQVNDLFKEFNISAKFTYDVGKQTKYKSKSVSKDNKRNPNKLSSPILTGIFQEVDAGDPQIYRVQVKNTGNLPIRDLPVRLVLNKRSENLKILAVKHSTTPKHEFGEIKEDFSDAYEPRFIYTLLNPADEDEILFIASERVELEVYAKAEGVSVAKEDLSVKGDHFSFNAFVFALIAIALAVFSIFIRQIISRRNQ